jgi:hypothetical protein
MKRAACWLVLGCGIAVWGFGCAGSDAREDGKKDAKNDKSKGTVVTIDGLKSTTPGEWVEEKPTSKMRHKQFRLPAVGDDKDNAELVIYFFGAGSGGSAEDNIKRWKGQFVPPEGKKIDDVAKTKTFKVGDVDVTYLDVTGTYLFKERPFDPDAETTRRPNWRMLGVVFESPNGPYFMKLVGPADTVKHYKEGFDDWLKGFKK